MANHLTSSDNPVEFLSDVIAGGRAGTARRLRMSHPELWKRSPWRLRSKVAVIASLVTACHLMIAVSSSPSLRLISALTAGYLMVGLYVLAHEVLHQKMWSCRWLDDLSGTAMMAPMFVWFPGYRSGHAKHHAYSTTSRDPGLVSRPNSLTARFVISILHYINMSYIMTPPIDYVTDIKERGAFRATLAVAIAFWPVWVVLMVGDDRVLCQHLLVPYLAFCLFNTIKNSAEHDYLYGGEDGNLRQGETSRSIKASVVTRFFWSNCNYHAEHHCYPGVPYWSLPKVARLAHRDRETWTYGRMWLERMRRGVQYPLFV